MSVIPIKIFFILFNFINIISRVYINIISAPIKVILILNDKLKGLKLPKNPYWIWLVPTQIFFMK